GQGRRMRAPPASAFSGLASDLGGESEQAVIDRLALLVVGQHASPGPEAGVSKEPPGDRFDLGLGEAERIEGFGPVPPRGNTKRRPAPICGATARATAWLAARDASAPGRGASARPDAPAADRPSARP